MLVHTVMTTPVISVDPSTSVEYAARLMIANGVSGLPVISKEGRELVGIVSEGDFLRRAELGTEPKRSWWLQLLSTEGSSAEEYVHTHGRTVANVMSTNVVTVNEESPLEDAVSLMVKRNIKRLPVLQNGRMVGIVTRSDLLKALMVILSSKGGGHFDDSRIRSDIETELARQNWGGPIRVSVVDGVVDLDGAVFDDRVRAATRVAAENVRGVKSVNDNLVYVEPLSGLVIMP